MNFYKLVLYLFLISFSCYSQVIPKSITASPVSAKSWDAPSKNLIFGEEIQFKVGTETDTVPVKTTYKWDFGDGNSSSEENPKHTYSGTSCSKNYTVNLTVTNYGNTDTTTHPESKVITVYYRPILRINSDDFDDPTFSAEEIYFVNCREAELNPADVNFYIGLNNKTPNRSCLDVNSFTINWGDGSSVERNISYIELSNKSHTYKQFGSFKLLLTVLSSEGVKGQRYFDVINDANPVMGLPNPGSTVGCAPYSFISKIPYENNSNSTKYSFWINGDIKTKVIKSQEEVAASMGEYIYTFTESSCGIGSNDSHTIYFEANNGCSSTPGTIGGIVVSTGPIAIVEDVASGCVDQNISFQNLSIKGKSKKNRCLEGVKEKYSWDFGDGTSLKDVSYSHSVFHSYSMPGIYKVVLSARATTGCSNISKDSIYVTINPDPNPKFDYSTDGECLTELKLTNTSEYATSGIKWVISPNSGFKYTSGSSSSNNATIKFEIAGTYSVKILASNNCSSDVPSDPVEFTVKDKPDIVIPSNFERELCAGEAFSTSSEFGNAIYVENGSAITEYTWQTKDVNGNDSTLSKEAYPNIVFNAVGLHDVKVIAKNACGSSERHFKVEVPSTPVIDTKVNGKYQVSVSSKTGTSVVFESTKAEYSHTWKVFDDNNNIVSTGNNATFNFIPSDIGEFKVTQTLSNDCETVDATFTISVYGDVSVDLRDLPSLCKGEELDLSNWVSYSLNNVNVNRTWSVSPTNGVSIDNATIEYPTITFAESGDFKVKVELENVDTKEIMSTEKTIEILGEVKAIAKTPDLTAGKIIVKQDTEFKFEDQSTGKVYNNKWEIINTAGGSSQIINTKDLITSISSPGDYQILQIVSNSCFKDTAIYSLIVQGNVSATIDDLDPICVGETIDFSGKINYNYNNAKVSRLWSVSPNIGVAINGIGEEFPTIAFSDPGVFIINVLLTNEDTKEELIVSKEIEVHGTIKAFASNSSLKNDTVFTKINTRVDFKGASNSSGIIKSYQWEISPNVGVNSGPLNLESTYATFSKAGSYTLTQIIGNTCYADTAQYHIIVSGPLNANFANIPSRCLSDKVNLKDYFSYSLNNNKVAFKWSISPFGGAVLSSNTDTFPELSFSSIGEYALKVNLNVLEGTSPDVEKLTYITVNDEPQAEVVPSTLGGIVPFKSNWLMNSTGGNLTHSYEIKGPNGVISDDDLKHNQDTVIEFIDEGRYTVNYKVENNCGSDQKSFTINASGSPYINLFNLFTDNPCNSYVFDAKQKMEFEVFTDSILGFEWNITRTDGGASGYQFLDETQATDTFPVIEFVELGVEYQIEVIMKTKFKPSGFSAQHKVFLMTPPVLKLTKPTELLCLSDTKLFQIDNTSEGDSILTKWSIEPTEGWSFQAGSDASSADCKIEFSKPQEYQIIGSIQNRCGIKKDTFWISVRGDVEAKLADDFPAEYCMEPDSTLEIDFTDKVSYIWNNNPDSVIWNITHTPDISLQYLNGTDSTSLFPKVLFKGVGTVQVDLNAYTKCNSVKKSKSFNLLANFVKADFTSSDTLTCVGTLEFNRTSIGDELIHEWQVLKNGTLATNDEVTWEGTKNDDKIRIQFKKWGNYEVILSEQNFCKTTTKKQAIRVFEKPEITKLIKPEQKCGSSGFNANASFAFNENGSTTSVEWNVYKNNSLYQQTNVVYPKFNFPFSGNYKIKVELENECGIVVSDSVFAKVDSALILDVGPDIQVCIGTEAPELKDANYNFGTWSCIEDASRINIVTTNNDTTWYFKTDVTGFYTAVYSLANGTCILTDTLFVEVIDLPEIIVSDTFVCINNKNPFIINFEPKGGIWSGDGVTNKGVFYVDSLTKIVEQVVDLKYSYISGETGCSNTKTIKLDVKPKPNPEIQFANPVACINQSTQFTPNNVDGVALMEWDFGDSIKHISYPGEDVSHIYSSWGYKKVRAKYITPFACTDSTIKELLVLGPPPKPNFEFHPDYGIKGTPNIGCAPFNPHFIVDTTEYKEYENQYDTLSYIWDFGNGQTFNGLVPPDTVVYQQGILADTTYSVKFIVSNRCFSDTIEQFVIVKPKPVAKFALMHRWECSPVYVRFINLTTGLPENFLWDFGDGTTSREPNPSHVFEVDTFTLFTIKLIATNDCGVDTFPYKLPVKPGTVDAFFAVDKRVACVGEPISFKNYSTDQSYTIIRTFWDFGDGSTDTATISTNHTYTEPGMYYVKLSVNNYCGYDSIMDSIWVEPIPESKIIHPEEVCENETVSLSYDSEFSTSACVWVLDETDTLWQNKPEVRFNIPGKHSIKLTTLYNPGLAKCEGYAESIIQVNPSPKDSIVPQLSIGCSPFEYVGKVEGESVFYSWNFGEDSMITGNNKHIYINTGDKSVRNKVTVYIENQYGCTGKSTAYATVAPQPEVNVEKELLESYPAKVVFYNFSKNATNCLWVDELGDTIKSCDNLIKYYADNGTYNIKLIAYNTYNCYSEDTISFTMSKSNLFFPNAFIPNHQNTEVAVFKPIGMGLIKYKLEVYDKWNNKVWETSKLEHGKPLEAWDGKNINGKAMPQGVYYWRCSATFNDNRRWKNNSINQGTITLIR